MMNLHNLSAPMLEGLPFPEEMIGSRAIIQGASGAGKTYAMRKILESTYGRMQQIILDVEDDLFTLREKFDYLLIGGDGADVPLDGATADRLAPVLLETGMSAILQLNDFGLSGQRFIIGKFIAGLMKAPRPLWHPVLVAVDEAHRYVPERGVVESSEALINLATAGRKRSFSALFATQRLSAISKDVLGQCPNRVIGRVDQALDKRAAAEILGFPPSSEDARGLMTLRHQFWIVGPAFAQTPKLVKFGPAKTTHIRSGQREVPVPPPAERVRALIGQIAAISPAPEEPKNQTRAAKNFAADIQKAIDKKVAAERKNWIAEGDASGYRRGFAAGVERVRAALDGLEGDESAEAEHAEPAPAAALAGEDLEPWNAPPGSLDPLQPAKRRILDALAWLEAAEIAPATRVSAAFVAEVSSDSSAYTNNLGELRTAGLVTYPAPGMLALTDAGREKAAKIEKPATLAELHSRISRRFQPAQNRILSVIIDVWPNRIGRDKLAEDAGASSSSSAFTNNLGRLRSLGLIDYPLPGFVAATEILFPASLS